MRWGIGLVKAGFHTICKNFETRIKPLKHMGFSPIAPHMA
jgi:hypothetical protein